MIKDCLEDYMFLLNASRKPAKQEGPATAGRKNTGGGFPTVEEVERVADLYYGPPKRTHFIAWTCSA
jgi:hypothetical protein